MDLASFYLPSQDLVTATNLAQELWKSSYSNLVGFTVCGVCVCEGGVGRGKNKGVESVIHLSPHSCIPPCLSLSDLAADTFAH